MSQTFSVSGLNCQSCVNHVTGALSALPGREQILRFALPSEVVRRVVLTIDNLPGDTMSMQYRARVQTRGCNAWRSRVAGTAFR